MHESRCALRLTDGPTLESVTATQLEERILMSVSPVAVAQATQDAGTTDVSASTNADAFALSQLSLDVVSASRLPAVAVAPEIAVAAIELVFVDASISDFDRMIEDLQRESLLDDSRELEIIVLDSERDGIAQITATLLQYDGVDGMHVVSHGDDGHVKLGATTLSLANVDTYQTAITAWQHSLKVKADVLFYGCNLAATEEGRDLMTQIGAACNCDIAASEDLTGNSRLGGDWDLEFAVGAIETSTVFSASFEEEWEGVLATFVVTNTNDQGPNSLRQAILDANASIFPDFINFDIPDTDPGYVDPDGTPANGDEHWVIDVATALPNIGNFLVIDGTSQPGYFNAPVIELSGTATTAANGLTVSGIQNTIRGLSITDFDLAGINITSGLNTVSGNHIGTDTSGLQQRGNRGVGIRIEGGNSNVVGGTSAADRNVIADNAEGGVHLIGTTDALIRGNYIGVDVTGNQALGNLGDGILIDGDSTGIIIGGDSFVGEGNVISGNTGVNVDGIKIANAPGIVSDNQIIGNFIGTNLDGTAEIGNSRHGVAILDGAQGNAVGGIGIGQGNTISGNGEFGIVIDGLGGDSTISNTVVGNTIGLDFSGTSAVANMAGGIRLADGASLNTIGGVTAAHGNVISGNTNVNGNGDGIVLMGVGTSNNVIQNNIIGLDSTGSIVQGNAGGGVVLTLGADSNEIQENVISANASNGIASVLGATDTSIENNNIGTDSTGYIAFGNHGHGVYLSGTGADNTINQNLISGNVGSGISVVSAGDGAATITRNSIGIDASQRNQLLNANTAIDIDSTSGISVGGNLTVGNTIASAPGTAAIEVSGSVTVGTSIKGNYIGTNEFDDVWATRSSFGVSVYDTTGAVIGGSIAGEGNIIGGYLVTGINISGSAIAGAKVEGNYIGTNAAETVSLFPGNYGVTVQSSAGNVDIGGALEGAGNTIANHSDDGVRIWSSAGDANQIRRNSIYNNAGLGINLQGGDEASIGNSVTVNDLLDVDAGASAPNELQNFPQILSAHSSGATTDVTVSLSAAAGTTYMIDLYGSRFANTSGYGEGRTWLDAVTLTTDATGNAVQDFSLPVNTTIGDFLTATATSLDGNTSEFGLAVPITGGNQPPVLTLTPGNTGTYQEGGAFLAVDGSALLTDADSADFGGGELLVFFSGDAELGDTLMVRTEGDGPDQVEVNGVSILIGGRNIGSVSGGANLTPMSVTLTDMATADDVQKVIRRLHYFSVSQSPTSGTRTVSMQLLDGDGGASNVATRDLTVQAVNDAPVLSATSTMLLLDITEDDIHNVGNTVAEILSTIGDPITDADSATAPEGIAVMAGTAVNGSWQFLLEGDVAWINIGSVTNATALLLRDVDRVRFLPNTIDGGISTLGFRAWDLTSGVAGEKAAATPVGGDTAFSSQTATAHVTVTAVNDAPTVTSPAAVDTAVDVPVLLTGVNRVLIDDVDAGSSRVSVTLAATMGTLTLGNSANVNLTLNSGSLMTFDETLADVNAALDGTQFVPDPGLSGTAIVTVQVDDNGNTGGRNLFDAQTIQVNLGVINSSPTADAGGAYAIAEGDSITLLSDGSTDPDADPLLYNWDVDADGVYDDYSTSVSSLLLSWGELASHGISSNGTYSIGLEVLDSQGGRDVASAVIVVSDSPPTITGLLNLETDEDTTSSVVAFTVSDFATPPSSLVVTATSDDQTILPDANIILSGPGSDRTVEVTPAANVSGGPVTVTLTVSDGQSNSQSSFDLNVNPVNDAPVFGAGGAMTLTTISEDASNPTGDAVADILLSSVGDRITDVDVGAEEGIAVEAIDSSLGTWQYSLDNGSTWLNFGDVSPNSATLLDPANRIRLLPNINVSGTVSIDFRAWDQSDGNVAGQTGVDVSASGIGGTSAFSLSAQAALITVEAVNDPPVGLPAILGNVQIGQILVAERNAISDADGVGLFAYQWLRDGIPINGATGNTYAVVAGDSSSQLSVAVSYTDAAGTNEGPLTSPAVAVNNTAPAITLIAGQTVAEDTQSERIAFTVDDAETSASLLIVSAVSSDQNLLSNANITIAGSGANRTIEMLPSPNQFGGPVTVTVMVTDGMAIAETTFEVIVLPVNDPAGGTPVVVGTPQENEVLTSDTSSIVDADGIGSLIYQWFADDILITGATSEGFRLSRSEVGKTISVEVALVDAEGYRESPLRSLGTLPVVGINQAPRFNAVEPLFVSENATNGTTVGRLSAIDSDAGDVLTYQLLTESDFFAIDSLSGHITVSDQAVLDFEVNDQFAVEAIVTDSAGLSDIQSVLIHLIDVNEDAVQTIEHAMAPAVTFVEPLEIVSTAQDEAAIVHPAANLIGGMANVRTTASAASVTSAVMAESGTTTVTLSESLDTETSESDSAESDSAADPLDNSTLPAGSVSVKTPTAGPEAATVAPIPSPAGVAMDRVTRDASVTVMLDDVPIVDVAQEGSRRSRREANVATNEHRQRRMTAMRLPQDSSPRSIFAAANFDLAHSDSSQDYQEQIREEILLDRIVVGGAAAVSTSLSVGYLVWILKGGTVATTFLSSIPVWQAFDPLPVLDSFADRGDETRDESLMAIASGR